MMEKDERQAHWDSIFAAKTLEERSWYEATPNIALDLLDQLSIPKEAAIIDVGGGDSLLVDHLLDLGYSHLSVLDISAKALSRAQTRLGERAKQVNWITSDVLDFVPTQQYDFWYDRAAFHFLTAEADVQQYVDRAAQGVRTGGVLVLGTFSTEGPQKCSGLEIRQYSAQGLTEVFAEHFQKIECFPVEHHTPAQIVQHFTFCVFRRK